MINPGKDSNGILGPHILTSYQYKMLHIPGTASVARAWSSYVDSIVGNKISEVFKANVHMGSGGTFSDYPDFFAFSITLVLTGRFILFPIKITNSVITYLVLQIGFSHIIFLDFSYSGSRSERIVNSEQHFYWSKSVGCGLCCDMRII